MFRALLWKEWRQLALVRWGGIVLGAVLPLAFTVGAQLASRGVFPLGKHQAYSTRDLMFEVLPAVLGLGLWPLMALMATAQGFAADRALGTENFLLERPVPRGRVWLSRLLTTFATLVLVIVVTAVLAMLTSYLASAPPAFGWMRWKQWTAGGAALALVAYLGGTIASSLLTSPLGSVLAGAVLAGLPVFLALQLAASFPFARLADAPLGLIAVLLLPAFVAASWASFCRGEPAGRGRVTRGLGLVSGVLAAVLVVFAILAPLIVRIDAGRGMHGVLAARSGRSIFVAATAAMRGGWIVDPASGRKRSFVAPALRDAAWSPDGSQLAVVTWSASLGGMRNGSRIDVRDAGSGEVVRSIDVPADDSVVSMAWASDAIVVASHRPDGDHPAHLLIDIVDPRAGTWKTTEFIGQHWGVLSEPDPSGRVFLRIPRYEGGVETRDTLRGIEIRPIDVAAAQVDEPLSNAAGQPILFSGWEGGLSPSGKLAMVSAGANGRGAFVQDVATGATISTTAIPNSARWLADDRLFWLARKSKTTRLIVMTPGQSPKAIREWEGGNVGLESAPDLRAVFVSALRADPGPPPSNPTAGAPESSLFAGDVPRGDVPEEGVFQTAGDRWISVPAFSKAPLDRRYTQWAGPSTLARIASGVVYLEDIGKPAEKRFVLGGEGDLR
jgi:ABC-type transport system involved in multi-copper enzyme maturation permease subunit